MKRKKRSPAPIRPRPKLTFRQWLLVLVFTAILLFGLHLTGVINLPFFNTFNFGFQNTENLPFNELTIGVPYAIDFPSSLIPLLPSESTGGPYTFYLGSRVGSLPMGLILGIDGVLRGTPTAASLNEFQVCVKDVGGRSACKTYQFITVYSGTNASPTNNAVVPVKNTTKTNASPTNNAVVPVKNTTKQPALTCPATSCETGDCCGAIREDETSGPGPHPATVTDNVMVNKSCGCPSDTTLSPDQGGSGPYKRCECNFNH